MKLDHPILWAAALSLTATPLAADPAGFAFLEVPAGARASAMAGAYSSVAQGAEAAFWNPAGLAAAAGIEITASHYEFLQGLRHAQFGIAGRLWGGGLSGAVRAMYSEPIVRRDEIGNEIGTFGAHDLDFSVGYGRQFPGGLRAGGSAHVVRERIETAAATTYAFGGGLTWDPASWPGVRLGLATSHLGPAAAYVIDGARGQPVSLPSALQMGGSYRRPLAGGLEVCGALETRLTRGRNGVALVGAEVRHGTGAALRAGFRFHDEATTGSFGAGYAAGALSLDYAFVPYRLELGDTHGLSLSARF